MPAILLLFLATPIFPGDKPPAWAEFPRRNAIVIAVKRTGPAVVNISTERIVVKRYDPFFGMRDRFFDPFFEDFFSRFGREQRIKTHSLGSGVILDSDGLIVTNEHVVRKASKINVILADGTELEAELASADPEQDIAVLKVPSSPKLKAAPVGTSSDLMIGETAIALGNPFGLENSVSVGVISAKNRTIMAEGKVLYKDLIQTDAAVNPGNSGGPLLNIRGEVIGINTAIYAEGQGIGFAIPIDKVISIIEGFLDYRVMKEIWIGLEVQSVTKEMAQAMGVDAKGVIVSHVDKNSPAAKAGLAVGDIIRKLDGKSVNRVLDFKKGILHHEKGDKARIEFLRNGKSHSTTLVLQALPKQSPEVLIRAKMGLQVQALTPLLARRLGLRAYRGILITEVEKNGPADVAGLRQLDVILQIGRFRIERTRELGGLLSHLKPGVRIPIIVARENMLGRTVLTLR